MHSAGETILLLGLSASETRLITRLVSSFTVDAESITVNELENFKNSSPNKKVCLIVFQVDEDSGQQQREISRIRQVLGDFIPLLILIPPKNIPEIKKYLKAGGDDYITLPLNENHFSVTFLILLEIGQAMAQLPQEKTSKSGGYIWNRMVNYFQAEESYFSPRSLTGKSENNHILHKWKRVRRIGLGGFGVVWLVEEIATGRLAVSKAPHSAQMNIRVLRSAAILKRLIHHPNIAQLIEVLKQDGKFILIQEYVDGFTLQELLKTGITPQDKEKYFLQLLSAVAYSHSHKILHRDIKPENIMITRTGQLKLLDFGIAKDLSWLPPGKSSEGTLDFMSPEQYDGKSCLASDVWSLGVILYIFATNSAPYHQYGDMYPVDIETVLKQRAPRRIKPDISPELDRIIMTCLTKDLDRRYEDGNELQQDLLSTLPLFGSGALLTDFNTPKSVL
ncbi:MAG: serine/threonine protein kinase [Deltaproteobacteria bacterium]|nr:serine/threonine protein kinase [Deltaproteobacteria bacterium]